MTRLAMALAAWLIGIPSCLAANSPAAPVAVSPEGQSAAAPDLAVNGRGEIALLWVDRSPQLAAGAGGDRHVALTDLYVAVSRDGGGSFGEPVRVNRDSGAVWGQAISRPRIVGSRNGSWHVTYTANERDAGSGAARLSTHYARSTDGGRSFGPSRQLSAPATQDLSAILHGGFASAAAFGTLAAAPDGSVHAYWIDTRHMTPAQETAALYGVSSRDDGVTFLAERRILERDVCPCCQLMAVTGPGSGMLLGSREVREGQFRPATVARLEPRGARPFERADVGGAPWQIAGCPMKPTVLAAQGDQVLAAVHSGGEPRPGVILSHSRDGGRSFWSLGLVHPEAAVSDAPSIAISGSVALVAWHAKLDGPRRVFHRLYDLSGSPLGGVQELDTGDGVAQWPVVAARPDGSFQLAWQQGDRILTTAIAARPRSDVPVRPVTAPEFRAALASQRGKVLVLHFWATWCAPCLREIPELLALEASLRDSGVTLLGVAIDDPTPGAAQVEAFRQRYFPGFVSYARADGDIDALASVVDPAWNEVAPTTYVIDRAGRVAQRFQGQPSGADLRAAIDRALQPQGPRGD